MKQVFFLNSVCVYELYETHGTYYEVGKNLINESTQQIKVEYKHNKSIEALRFLCMFVYVCLKGSKC